MCLSPFGWSTSILESGLAKVGSGTCDQSIFHSVPALCFVCIMSRNWFCKAVLFSGLVLAKHFVT